MDNVLYTVQSSVYQSSLERVGADTVNTLIKTSGSPYDWQDIGTPQVVGLAKYDVMKQAPEVNYLSPYKLAKVKTSDITKLTGSGYGFYLDITDANNTRVIKRMGTEDPSDPVPDDISDVVRIERIVLSSNLEIITSLKGLVRDAGQPRTYEIEFPTNIHSIDSYEYWILVINHGYTSATVDVNNNNVIDPSRFNQEEIKEKINVTYLKNETDFQDNIVNVRTESSPGASMDVYVIVTPKDISPDEITLDNVELKQCKFVFYIWTV